MNKWVQNTLTKTTMTSAKKMRMILFPVLTIFVFSTAAEASSQLSLVKSSDSSVEILLRNEEPVAGIQFTIHASQNIRLGMITSKGRTDEGSWIMSSNRVNDTTVYVLFMRSGLNNLPSGSESIAELTMDADDNAGSHRVWIDDIVVSTPLASRLPLSSDALEWSGNAASFALGQNYPNPFNPTTTIPFRLQEPAPVILTVYDISGREIKKISEGTLPAGPHSATWNSSDEHGSIVPSGIYFVRLQVGDKCEVRKMILTK